MAQVTDPIMLDSTGQAIKNSIDLLSANINRTASNIPYDDNVTIKAAIDRVDLRAGGNIGGNLTVAKAHSQTSGQGTYLYIGNNKPVGQAGNSRGILTIYDTNQYSATILAGNGNLTADRWLTLPDKTATLVTDNEISNLTGKPLEVIYNAFNVTINGQTYNGLPISGIKIVRPDDTSRYMIIGFVNGGSNLYGAVLTYSSMTNIWTKIG